jgi:hypothetical protein
MSKKLLPFVAAAGYLFVSADAIALLLSTLIFLASYGRYHHFPLTQSDGNPLYNWQLELLGANRGDRTSTFSQVKFMKIAWKLYNQHEMESLDLLKTSW